MHTLKTLKKLWQPHLNTQYCAAQPIVLKSAMNTGIFEFLNICDSRRYPYLYQKCQEMTRV